MSARCYRDRFGIPHLRADDLGDLAWAQGYECARSRCWQLDYQHRRGLGRTAELFGEAALDWDVFARRTQLAPLAQRIFAGLPEETRAFLGAYVDGVNDGFASLESARPDGRRSAEHADLDADPLPWQPWSPIVGYLAIHILFGRLGDKLFAGLIESRLGPEGVRLFNAEGPSDLSGSNSMVVGGGLTATGSPFIAGDSHRNFEDPNPYYQVHLSCPEFDVVGFAFPGVPGIAHFAHTGEVAWAVTNAGADAHDVFVERLDDEAPRHTETVDVRTDDGLRSHEVEVIRGRTGPVIFSGLEAGLPAGTALTVRTTEEDSGRVGFEALLPLLRSRTVADVMDALGDWVDPVNNVVIADSTGATAHRVAGLVPERDRSNRRTPADASSPGSSWRGFVTDLPGHDPGPDGRFVTANDRANADYDRIGDEFAGRWRADRIRELVDALPPGYDAVGLLGVLLDDLQTEGVTLLSAVASARALSGPAAALQAELGDWDRFMDADSRTALAYIAVRDALARRLAAQPAFDGLRDPFVYGTVFAPSCDLTARLTLCLPAFLSDAEVAGIEVAPLVAEALEQVAAERTDAVWGSRHLFRPWHAFALHGREWRDPASAPRLPSTPLPSDRRCVRAVTAAVGSGAATFGSVTRYLWDLADRDGSRWVVPLGSAGDPASPHHHDQLALWSTDGTVEVITDIERLDLEAEWPGRTAAGD